MSIKSRLIILFTSMTTIAIIFIGMISLTNASNNLMRISNRQLEIVADAEADMIGSFFEELKSSVLIAQDYYNIKLNLPVMIKFYQDRTHPDYIYAEKLLDGQLRKLLKIKKDIIDIILVSPEGKIVYSANEDYRKLNLDNPLPDPDGKAFEEGRKEVYFGRVFSRPRQNVKFELLLTAPIFDFQKRFIGVLAFEIDLSDIYKSIEDTAALGKSGETLIVGKEDKYSLFLNPLRYDPDAALKRKVYFGDKKDIPEQKAVMSLGGSGIFTDYRDKEVLAVWRPIPIVGWGMVTKMDMKEIIKPIVDMRNLIIVICLIVLTIIGVIAVAVANSISDPICSLCKGTEIIGSGNLDYKVGTKAEDEIGQLSRAFDRMTDNLKRTTASMDELNKERQAAEFANHAKSDFISNMSHELRTPLNAIIGFSEVLYDQKFGSLNDTQKDYLNDILESSQYLLSLINDILDISKVESGKMEVALSDFSLKELLEHSLILIKEKALNHNIGLSLTVDKNLEYVRADERKVKQIIFNLLSNAVKFSPNGSKISIRARSLGSEVEITVWDNGIGISKEDQNKLFNEFVQLEAPLIKKYEGTGIGLALAKKLVQLHKGRIWVESEGKGKGSSFKFTLPIKGT